MSLPPSRTHLHPSHPFYCAWWAGHYFIGTCQADFTLYPAMDVDIEIDRAAEDVLWHTRISPPVVPGVPYADVYGRM